jgi:hypothetical protein
MTTMKNRLLNLLVLVALIAGLVGARLAMHEKIVQAQGYSGALPNVLTPASGLVVTYTAGTVVSGGLQQAITGSTVTVSNTQTDCSAPGYASCNFVFWAVGGGTALSTSTTAATAFAPGNVVVAFVTATGGNVSAVTPASWSPWTASVGNQPGGTSNTAGAYWVSPGNCWYSVATGTLTTPTFGAAPGATALGLNVVGASNVPVMQVSTTNAAVISTNTISCVINPPSTVGITGRGVNLTDAVVVYGIQQAGGVNATQVSVAASGTFNGTIVFDKVAFPTPGAAETPSTVTPVRADAGTLAFAPTAAAFNSLVTTAGAFFTQKFTPATSFALNTDLTIYHINFAVLCNTTQATTINVAGVLVHYTS